ncbi:MAG: hypothetical protein JWR60_4205 [Polaromonas sp.]|nr:hypothetical protein [Polaromonas sp.]
MSSHEIREIGRQGTAIVEVSVQGADPAPPGRQPEAPTCRTESIGEVIRRIKAGEQFSAVFPGSPPQAVPVAVVVLLDGTETIAASAPGLAGISLPEYQVQSA